MDCFEFHHWRSGQHLRALVYGMEEEREWERAEGTPEPWEHDFFFHPKNLEYVLADAENEEHREMIQQAYSRGTIEEGQTEPGISSKETADAIAQFYGFPFFE